VNISGSGRAGCAIQVAVAEKPLRGFAAVSIVAVLILGAPIAARAQAIPPPSPPSPGWYITPSFTLAEEFDDNVFVSSTDKQSDFITRFTPGVEVGYRSEPFTLLASSSFDAEIFARNTELSDAANRKRAGLEVKYLPYRLLTLALDVSYFETNTPTELVPTTGLQLARTRATELLATPTATYQFTAIDSASLAYTYGRETLEGGLDNQLHRVRAAYTRQFTPLDTGIFAYRLNVYETQDSPTTTSNTITGAWVRQLTPNTMLTLEAGPRFIDDGSVEPEAHGRIEHSFKLAKVALDYVRTEVQVVGRPGKFELESVTGTLEIEPIRSLKVRLEPGYYRTFGGADPTATVYGLALSGTYPIKAWLSARLAYRYAHETQGSFTIDHNIVTLGLDLAYPFRVFP
jgi:hypothetical protein